jgi:YbbR domain-containing protein
MLRDKIANFFRKNYQAKVLSVASALVAWFIISLNQSSIVNYPNKIEISFEGLKDNLVSVAADNNVQIKINVDPIKLKDLKDSDFTASIDLTGLENGVYEKEIKVATTSSEVQIISCNPRKTTVKIDTRETKNVPVRVKYDGAAAEGYIVSDASAEPEEVQVVGPKSTIDTITETVAPIKINGEKEGFEKISQLFVYDAQGDEIKFVKIEPLSIKTKISISPAGDTKTVGIKVKTSGGIKSGFWINSIVTEPQTVTISGSRTKLSQTQYVETEAIDLTDLDDDKTFSTQLNVDNGIKVEDKYSSIKVTIDIEKSQQTKTVEITPKFKNIPSGLDITTDPQKASVELASSKSSIEDSDVVLEIDLGSYTKGEREIELSEDYFTVANGVKLEKILTPKIKIILE